MVASLKKGRRAKPPWWPKKFKLDPRPLYRRFEAASGLSLHDAMIFYGPEYEAGVVAELELMGFNGAPPMAVDESGWPNLEEEREFRIKGFRLQQCSMRLQQQLLRKLEDGELYATGYSATTSLDKAASRVAPDRWRILKANFETSEASSSLGLITGILVFAPSLSQAVTTEPGRFSSAALRNWYVHWVSKNQTQGKMPSGEEDWAAAKSEFGEAVPRSMMRNLRRELAPPEWTRLGRRKSG